MLVHQQLTSDLSKAQIDSATRWVADGNWRFAAQYGRPTN